MKKCSRCKESKSLESFHRSKTGTFGRCAYCKECSSSYSRARFPEVYAITREATIARAVAWQKANPDRYRARLTRWQEENRDHLRAAKLANSKRYVDDLYPGYVASCIGMPVSLVPTDLMDAKREQLHLRRLANQLRQEIINQQEKANGN